MWHACSCVVTGGYLKLRSRTVINSRYENVNNSDVFRLLLCADIYGFLNV